MTANDPPSAPRESISLERALDLLAHGEIALQGQFPWSSNYTFLVSLSDAASRLLAVYKPTEGERPLWDFDPGSLCRREVAAYLLSQALSWPDIPPVVLRDGPFGVGSVQLFVEADYEQHYFTLRQRPELTPAFQRIALFDHIANNADRKGGHVLLGAEGVIWAIDHGLTFHNEYKLRTVIWEHAGRPIPPEWLAELAELRVTLAAEDAPLRQALLQLLSPPEVVALRARLNLLLRRGVFPLPRRDWRNTPYPLV